MGVCTGSGISERSTGPGYGRCDDKVVIHLRRVLLASRGAKVWGTEAGVAAAKENTRMRFTKAGLQEGRSRSSSTPGQTHPDGDDPQS